MSFLNFFGDIKDAYSDVGDFFGDLIGDAGDVLDLAKDTFGGGGSGGKEKNSMFTPASTDIQDNTLAGDLANESGPLGQLENLVKQKQAAEAVDPRVIEREWIERMRSVAMGESY